MVKRPWLIVLLVVLLDQLTKFLVQAFVRTIPIIPGFLSLDNIHNYGAGFGILQGQRMLLIWLSLIVIGFILYYYDRLGKDRIAAMLILSGALGNLIDRIFLIYVVDFIHFSFFPAFNAADSAVTIGAALLIWNSLRKKS